MRTVFRSMVWMVAVAVAACGGGDGGSGPSEPETGGAQGLVQVGTTGLAGVSVSATKGSTTRQATTGATGQFSFSNLEVGSWTFTMTAPTGYALATGETGTRSVSVTANAVAQVGTLKLAQTGGGGGNTKDVEMSGQAFSPQTVNLTVGQSVRWTNKDQTAHNATGNGIATGNLTTNQTATVQFNTAGTFQYACTLHSGMTGTVVVQ